MSDELTYEQIIFGKDEPAEMWLTGAVAMELLRKMDMPLLDAHHNALVPDKLYYLSVPTGLVPEEDSA